MHHQVLFMEKVKISLKEFHKLSPINVYSFSKKNNEDMAEIYSNLYNMNFVALRLFYCLWRMGKTRYVFLKLLKAITNKETFI